MLKWIMSNENVKDFWNAITRNSKTMSRKDQEEFDSAMAGAHAILGVIAAIIAGINCLGLYVLLFLAAALLLGLIWSCSGIQGNLAAGYFFAMSAFSFAWIIYLPILLIVLIFSSPIIITSYLEFKKNESSR